MRLTPASLSLLVLISGIMACNAPSTGITATTTVTATIAPTDPSATDAIAGIPAASDTEAFLRQLEDALAARDLTAAQSLMGDAFFVSYWQSDSGAISTDSAVGVLRNDFLSGSAAVLFVPEINPSTIVGDSVRLDDPGIAATVFSTGWGEAARDHAILYVATDLNGALYWSGLIYA
ncbi:MAG: hypothetical protein IT326_01480, partial [Anaerolineae bacterium]|nr:hypothetical protein [Anaerolineae bacterium]